MAEVEGLYSQKTERLCTCKEPTPGHDEATGFLPLYQRQSVALGPR